MRALWACGLSLVALGSCSFDWDGFDPRLAGPAATAGPGGGASGGQGGAGGMGDGGGGGVTTLPAADWSSSMLAAYTFEDADDIGHDSSGHGLDLSVIALDPPTTTMDAEPKQGTLSLLVDYGPPQTGIESAAAEFESPAGTSLTWGGWVKARTHPATHPLDAIARTGDGGYALARDETNALQCAIYNGSWMAENAAADSWPLDVWVHLVCRYDDAAGELEGFAAGESVLLQGGLMGTTVGSRTFGLPSTESSWGFDGQLDDVFIVKSALSDEAIARIAACGVDGSKCICDPNNPIAYLDCGEAQPSCSTLAACNASAP